MTDDAPNGYRIRARGLGAPRNGMPPSADYAYRGTGEDMLTPPGVMASWNRRVRSAAGIDEPWARGSREALVRAEREIALREAVAPVTPRAAAPVPRPVQHRPQAAPSAAPEPAREPEREPAREPRTVARCASCGYLETAIGHKAACGGAP